MFAYDENDITEEIRGLPVDGTAIEGYPHVVEKLKLFWGYPEFLDYFQTLSQDTRIQVRKGFSNEALADLVFLYELYMDNMNTINRMKLTDSQIIVLDEKLKSNDIWAANFAK